MGGVAEAPTCVMTDVPFPYTAVLVGARWWITAMDRQRPGDTRV